MCVLVVKASKVTKTSVLVSHHTLRANLFFLLPEETEWLGVHCGCLGYGYAGYCGWWGGYCGYGWYCWGTPPGPAEYACCWA